jgi:hypothetical protein
MAWESDDLELEVELMDDPCLWRWAIRDVVRDQVLADSWTRDWTAYESREEAYRAGAARLRAGHR